MIIIYHQTCTQRRSDIHPDRNCDGFPTRRTQSSTQTKQTQLVALFSKVLIQLVGLDWVWLVGTHRNCHLLNPQLGIRDVFEPRQRDFTLMTRQSGVYVRSIEQAVSVAIRKYRPDDQKKNSEFDKLSHELFYFFLHSKYE